MEKSTMSVQDLSLKMGISLPKAYALVKEPDFPTIRIGTRILIPWKASKLGFGQSPGTVMCNGGERIFSYRSLCRQKTQPTKPPVHP